MAWLDDSPEVNAEKQKSAKNKGLLKKEKYYGRSVLQRIPLLKAIPDYFFARTLHSKLNKIESKIKTQSLTHIQPVVNLLRELFYARKLYHHRGLLEKKNAHLLLRMQKLKEYLLQKSHHVMMELTEPAKTTTPVNSHQKVLDRLLQQPAAPQPENDVSSQWKVYWKHASKGYERRKQYFLHTTLRTLLGLLAHTEEQEILPGDLAHMHLSSDKNYPYPEERRFSCGITFRFTPTLLSKANSAQEQFSFWSKQHSQNAANTLTLANLINTIKLTDHIEGLFFNTDDGYEEFKQLALQEQNPKVIGLIDRLEQEEKISLSDAKRFTRPTP